MRAYFPNPPSEDAANELRGAISPHCDLFTSERPTDYEILIEGRADEEMLKAPSLKTVIVPFAGVPEATLQWLRTNLHVTGHNLHHNAADTAEVAIGLLFAASKLIVPMDQRMRKNDWGSRYEDSRAVALEGKTAVILGYGQIGQKIARVLAAAGLHVIAVRRNSSTRGADGIEIRGTAELASVLPRANVLMIALPQTAETVGMIGQNELELLPKDAVLVNIARGAVVDEEALYNALKSGRLHSAGLDVWYHYPQAAANTVPGYFNVPEMASNTPPSKFPFGELDNVVMSPHRAGTSMDTEIRRVRDLAGLILALAQGQQAPNKIDINAGY
jgi:phosphoglycerate dehydrogenase-like enzyme